MHAAWLWTAADQHGRRSGATSERTRAKVQPWIQRALAARGAAFNELVLAVRDAQAAGSVRCRTTGRGRPCAHRPRRPVSLPVPRGSSRSRTLIARRLAYLRKLLELTMQGLTPQPRGVEV
jgi:hypothetical protein